MELPGGFKGKSTRQPDIHNEVVDVSHVKSKIDTGTRRRARKSKKDRRKKHRRSLPVKSVSPTRVGKLPEIKRSASVPPGLANQTLKLKTWKMDEKEAMKQQAMKEMQVELATMERRMQARLKRERKMEMPVARPVAITVGTTVGTTQVLHP